MTRPAQARTWRSHVATAAVVLVCPLGLSGCHGSNMKNGEPVHEDAMKSKIIAVSRSVLTTTGIRLHGSAGLTFGSCTDDNVKPFRATVTSSFLGKSTLTESEHEVDDWVTKLKAQGWRDIPGVHNSATRYLQGPDRFSMAITPHVDPAVQGGADLVIASDCVVTDDVGNSPGFDVTHQVQP
jgi:hypothetical protein